MGESERKARAEARRRRARLRKTRLGEEAADFDLVQGADAVSLVTQLTAESWSMAGKALPTYTRARIPCRFVPGSGE